MTPKVQTASGDFSTTTNAATTAVTVTKPPNTVDDDTLLWVVGHRGPGALSAIPTGWTELASKFTTPYTLSVLYKKIPSAAAEVATSYTLTAPSSSRLCSAMFRVTDVTDLFTNVQGALSVITGTVNLILPTATSNSNYMLAIGVGFGGFAGNSGGAPYFVTPAGWTSCFIQDDLVINSASSSALCVYQKQLSVSGTVVPDLTVNINPIRPASNTEGFMLLLASKSGQDTSGTAKPPINQQIIAHRGTLGSADPKTEEQLSGIALLSSECNGVELDVQLASDSLATTKKAYLCHDTTTDRTSPNGTTGTVTSMTSAQLDAAQIMDLASYLTGIASKNYSTIMLQLYDASSPAIKLVSDICLASPLKDRIIFMLNAAGTQSTANLQMSNVRANWQGKAGVFQQTPTNWVFYQALYSTYSFKYAAITQGDPAYVTDRAHVQTLMSAGVNVIGSVLDGTSIPLAIQDNIFAILTNVSTTIINTYDVPDNVALPPSGSKIMSVTDNEYTSLVSVYGAGLSISDMRRKKWAGDLKTSMNDLEKAYYAGNDPWSLSEEQYKNFGGDPKNSLSDNSGSYWTGGSVAPPVTTVRNIVDRPAPVALTNWSSSDSAKWIHTYSGGIISIDRQATADPLVTAYVTNLGQIVANPVLANGSQWQRSVEVFSTVPVTVLVAAGGFPSGQVIPANVWTTIRNNFIGSGSAAYVTAFRLQAASDPGLGILTQLRHAMLVQAPPDKIVAYADGGSPGWTWEGTANASPSTGPVSYVPDRVNLATNPGYESGTNSIQTGSIPTYVLSADTVSPIGGSRSALFTKSATVSSTIAQVLCNIGAVNVKIPVTEGQPITGGLSIKTDTANAQVTTRWFWYDSGSVLTQGAATTRYTGMVAGQVYRVTETGTPPPGTVTAYFCVTVVMGSGNTVGGEKAWADYLTLENGTTDGSWF